MSLAKIQAFLKQSKGGFVLKNPMFLLPNRTTVRPYYSMYDDRTGVLIRSELESVLIYTQVASVVLL